MRTRNKILGVVLPVMLLVGAATPVLADTTGGGNADLGLDAIAITAAGAQGKTGIATISGTISCSQDLIGIQIFVELDQVVGRFHTLRGWAGATVDCAASDGSASWTLTIQPDQGKFANGRATITASAGIQQCDEEGCFEDSVGLGPQEIRLGR